jgi:precorrin-2 dehydrogenase/sirohydrochlorin ferrochelatase
VRYPPGGGTMTFRRPFWGGVGRIGYTDRRKKRYPIHVDLQGKRCVVVGAGPVAERKVRALLECGANICVVAPLPMQSMEQWAAKGLVTWIQARYESDHLDGAFLVIAATNIADVNADIAREAQERGILVCRADEPDRGNFVSVASMTRGDLTFMVSTGGQSPTLAAVIRERLAKEYGPEWEGLTALIGTLRPQIQAIGDEAARRSAVRQIVDDPAVHEAMRTGHFSEAEARAQKCLSSFSE